MININWKNPYDVVKAVLLWLLALVVLLEFLLIFVVIPVALAVGGAPWYSVLMPWFLLAGIVALGVGGYWAVEAWHDGRERWESRHHDVR